MRKIRILATAGALVTIFGAVYFVGIVAELEYPHWWVLAKVRSARTEGGVPIREVLEQSFGTSAERIHWHTCSYGGHSHVGAGETHVQFSDPRGSTKRYEFIYTHATKTLRPANDEAAHLLTAWRG